MSIYRLVYRWSYPYVSLRYEVPPPSRYSLEKHVMTVLGHYFLKADVYMLSMCISLAACAIKCEIQLF